MARIEDLVDEIDDPVLRGRLADEVAQLKRSKRFGLVFERHEPETVAVRARVRVGSRVALRTDPQQRPCFTVESVDRDSAVLVSDGGGETEVAPIEDVLVVEPFGEPVFPGLRPMGLISRGGDKPSHAVINGENYHALQVLLSTHARSFDAIYIDPPYNTQPRASQTGITKLNITV